jgi:hypothetical protein
MVVALRRVAAAAAVGDRRTGRGQRRVPSVSLSVRCWFFLFSFFSQNLLYNFLSKLFCSILFFVRFFFRKFRP